MLSEKHVAGRPKVHQPVGYYCAVVCDGAPTTLLGGEGRGGGGEGRGGEGRGGEGRGGEGRGGEVM